MAESVGFLRPLDLTLIIIIRKWFVPQDLGPNPRLTRVYSALIQPAERTPPVDLLSLPALNSLIRLKITVLVVSALLPATPRWTIGNGAMTCPTHRHIKKPRPSEDRSHGKARWGRRRL